MRSQFVLALSFGVVFACAVPASAVTVWDESINGDLSGNRLSPTGIMLNAGSNLLTATSVAGDREYVRFTLGPGLSLARIDHISWISDDDIAFIAVQAGTTFTEPFSGTNVSNLLGYSHFGSGSVGFDILDWVSTGAGSQMFTPPLTGTDYTFWIQQTGQTSTYTLDFFVTPSPGSGLAGVLVLGMLSSRRRR